VATIISKKRRCPGCGEKLDARWELCPYCGFGADQGAPPQQQQSGPPRTQALDLGNNRDPYGGNNNNYCHDDETTWFDWSLLERHADVHRFVSVQCARRTLRTTAHECRRLTLSQLIQRSEKSWHGVKLDAPDWGDSSHSIAFSAELREDGVIVHLIFNAHWEPLEFELPQGSGDRVLQWRRWIDTARPSPEDIVPWQDAPRVPSAPYRAGARSIAVLYAGTGPTAGGDGSASVRRS